MRAQYYPQFIDAGLGAARAASDATESWATSGQGSFFDPTDYSAHPATYLEPGIAEHHFSDDDAFELLSTTTDPDVDEWRAAGANGGSF